MRTAMCLMKFIKLSLFSDCFREKKDKKTIGENKCGYLGCMKISVTISYMLYGAL